ncbi:MAG TPA: glutamate--tRNA ligase [Burkholderiales bacterium]|jgi:glutamyl-tRNA synthetase|nr:glutamate--tRNA ligase [Burkholderiales bacterium]
MTQVRTRFAPSPTGMMHLGNARAGLFSWAYARHHGGKFILRIEDTDLERSTEAAIGVILDSMAWLGLDYDEGPIRQTARLDRYRAVLDEMLADGRAYKCYASREELEALREEQRAKGLKPRYDGRWRPENAQGKAIPEGVKPVIRFRNPDDGDVSWTDLVKGEISISNTELDDLVIARADLVPTYNFAVVVDDLDMAITHVVRGDDHVNNTPRQINIYRALKSPVPQFAHLPTILGPDGEKLSKRHGAISVMQYPADGYLPEALFNYLARLGWSHGDAEKFPREKFLEWFDLAQVSRSAAQFDQAKLAWLNHEYIKEADNARLAGLVAPLIKALGGTLAGGPDLTQVVALVKDRAHTLHDIANAALLFYANAKADPVLLAQHVTEAVKPALATLREKLGAVAWEKPAIAAAVKETLTQHGLKMPQLAMPVRALVAGQTQTPSLDAVLELFGRERVVSALGTSL